jgi:hypothetical protein
MPWNVDSKELAAEMQAYTLQEIGRTIAEDEAENPKVPEPRLKSPKSKFKPKKPLLRYHERHPDEVLSNGSDMDIDEPVVSEEDMDDDTEYIVDTYIRMPASSFSSQKEENFGLLVLDSQLEISLFYAEASASDEEGDEEEDENAEDHYTADYPDEEVESDDEFGRDAYRYQNHNAADLEEFDENDVLSDEEGDSMRYPWKTKEPAWLKKKADDTSDVEDEDDAVLQ